MAFYELYSKVFPNYMILNENKYLFKNIRKKQKMIDAANELLEEEEKSKILVKENNDLFTKTIKEEINNYQKINDFDIYINQSYEKSISISIYNKKKISQYLLRDNTPNEKKNTNFDSFVTNETNHSIKDILNILDDRKVNKKNKQKILKINCPKKSNILKIFKNLVKKKDSSKKNSPEKPNKKSAHYLILSTNKIEGVYSKNLKQKFMKTYNRVFWKNTITQPNSINHNVDQKLVTSTIERSNVLYSTKMNFNRNSNKLQKVIIPRRATEININNNFSENLALTTSPNGYYSKILYNTKSNMHRTNRRLKSNFLLSNKKPSITKLLSNNKSNKEEKLFNNKLIHKKLNSKEISQDWIYMKKFYFTKNNFSQKNQNPTITYGEINNRVTKFSPNKNNSKNKEDENRHYSTRIKMNKIEGKKNEENIEGIKKKEKKSYYIRYILSPKTKKKSENKIYDLIRNNKKPLQILKTISQFKTKNYFSPEKKSINNNKIYIFREKGNLNDNKKNMTNTNFNISKKNQFLKRLDTVGNTTNNNNLQKLHLNKNLKRILSPNNKNSFLRTIQMNRIKNKIMKSSDNNIINRTILKKKEQQLITTIRSNIKVRKIVNSKLSSNTNNSLNKHLHSQLIKFKKITKNKDENLGNRNKILNGETKIGHKSKTSKINFKNNLTENNFAPKKEEISLYRTNSRIHSKNKFKRILQKKNNQRSCSIGNESFKNYNFCREMLHTINSCFPKRWRIKI